MEGRLPDEPVVENVVLCESVVEVEEVEVDVIELEDGVLCESVVDFEVEDVLLVIPVVF